MIRPFFRFYGGKWRAAPHYPKPRFGTIIEPFAGSAGYALRRAACRVVLVERDPKIAATWQYLLRAKARDILRLPDLRPGQNVDDLPVCEEAKLLIGWWLNTGSAQPHKTPSAWMRRSAEFGGEGWATGGGQLSWGPRARCRIADQLDAIKHWKLIEGSYEEAPNVEATWFIDPPYVVAGKHYKFGSGSLDYKALARWCRKRKGQVIVCENEGADWLPFRPFRAIKATRKRASREVIWTQRGQGNVEKP